MCHLLPYDLEWKNTVPFHEWTYVLPLPPSFEDIDFNRWEAEQEKKAYQNVDDNFWIPQLLSLSLGSQSLIFNIPILRH